jgi:hypothetical protein
MPKDYATAVNQRQIEGIRADRLTPLPKGLNYEQLFMKYLNVFFHLSIFKREHAPFVERKVGPTWFVKEFPTTNVDSEDDVIEIWSAFLVPAIISCRIGKDAKSYRLVGYHPNRVSRQLGFSQIVPKSFYLHVKDVCLGYCGISEKLFKAFLKLSEDNKYGINPFPYTNSYYCSKGFADWWEQYYTSRTVEKNTLLSRLEIGFRQPQIEKIRLKLKPLGINSLTSLSLNQLLLYTKNVLVLKLLYIFFLLLVETKELSATSSKPAASKIKEEIKVLSTLFNYFPILASLILSKTKKIHMPYAESQKK